MRDTHIERVKRAHQRVGSGIEDLLNQVPIFGAGDSPFAKFHEALSQLAQELTQLEAEDQYREVGWGWSNIRTLEDHISNLLRLIDPTGPRHGTDDTPKRVAKMYLEELCSGYKQTADDFMRTFPSEGYDGMVIVKDIPVVSLCEHHLVPFTGYAHVGYFPLDVVVGLSKIPRLVNMHARRLQIQERLTRDVCADFNQVLNPRGVIVIVEAEHLCMTIRGVQAPGTTTITSAVTGLFEENKDGCKEEFLRLLKS